MQEGPPPPNENAGPTILGVTVGMTVLASVISFALRLYVRIRMIRKIGWDDYMMCIAALLSIIGMIIVIFEVQNGGGRHRQYVEPNVFSTGMYLNFLTQPIYLFIALFVKESVGFFLLRITGGVKYRILIISIMVVLAVYTVACFFTIVLQCRDLRIIWNPTVETTCWSIHVMHGLGYTNSVVNIVTDFAFAVLIPIPLIIPLQMSIRKKLSLLLILGMGVAASTAGIMRAVHMGAYGTRGDFLWDSSAITIWYVVETQVGVVAGNLPCAKPLLVAARCWKGSSSNTSGGAGRSGGGFFTKYYCGSSEEEDRRGSSWSGRRRSELALVFPALAKSPVVQKRGSSGEAGLVRFGGNGVEADTVAVVEGGGGGGGGELLTALGRVSDDGSIARLNREIGGRGRSISGPAGEGGGIVRTTKASVEYDVRTSIV
ncbi:Integral membrane protein [Lasiodiplodia theobromae]|uniref:Integral membrane protein n=1 Tax=Lasiodiplodia theobromae TaxID=45133 RepID=UPI0015C2D6B3|nr:Integral membrane protein [Lasiodiplodia theobromae]KAF4544800.1 Integral membrane protein [Lasiodiplodia theobromae]